MQGIFITFEGVDGCGKSTQTRFLAEYLKEERGLDVIVTREPGGSVIAEQIREILLDPGNRAMDDVTEALLYAAARAQHLADTVRPALEKGKIVLCDRFIDSSLAYQGVGRGLGIEEILRINTFATGGLMPDKTFFLDFPPDLAFERKKKKKSDDRLETQGKSFYEKLYAGFKQLVDMWPERIIRIDATGDKFTTKGIIREKMNEILGARYA